MLSQSYRSEGDIRRHQINTLKIFNDNVIEICEGHEYRISFMSGHNELCLQISLSNEFPNEKPLLSVSPAILHQWVNSDSEVISAPGLLRFTLHSDLGRVVRAIIREFERNPPPLRNECSSTSVSPKSAISSPTIPIRDERSSPSNFPTFLAPTHLTVLQRRLFFSELNNMSVEELETLNDNMDKQEEFLRNLPAMKQQNLQLDDLIVKVEELANSNLSKQDELKDARSKIDERIEEVTKLAFENERLYVEYQELADKYSPVKIKDQLRLAAQKAELDCENIADSFLKGELDVEKFINLYIKTKSLCQARKTKEEKLSQQLDRLSKAGF